MRRRCQPRVARARRQEGSFNNAAVRYQWSQMTTRDYRDPPAPQAPTPRRYRAMVVDDERDFLHLMTMFLQRSGMPIDVEAVGSGAEALQQAIESPPDLVLLDLMMPDIDGFEVCSRLRSSAATRATPVIMLTALDEPSDRTRGFLAGADDYLAKPFDRGELLARVRRVLQRHYGFGEPDAVAVAPVARAAGRGGRHWSERERNIDDLLE
jgi:DNA-binding response OmpR family regulator